MPRVLSPEIVAEPGLRDGGYLYIPPRPLGIKGDKVVSEQQAVEDYASFQTEVTAVTHPCRRGHWQPFFARLEEGLAKTTLRGLKDAIERFSLEEVPIAGITADRNGAHAVVADLAKFTEMRSWFYHNHRGVRSLGAAVMLSNTRHAAVFGNHTKITEIDDSETEESAPMTVLQIDYLPHYDDEDYELRLRGVSAVGIGAAAEALLKDNRLGHLWDQYLASAVSD
jgi:hypothetical protein